MKTKVAIIGSGNIGTDLMIKIIRRSEVLELVAFVGIDPDSDGLARAKRLNVPTTAEGIEGFLRMPQFAEVEIVFDATSAAAHAKHANVCGKHGKKMVDLTPAALGPYVVPPVNLSTNQHSPNINMVTCGGQATIPIVYAISRVTPVRYAEIVASIASISAGPGTRANIDEFTETTARAIEAVGSAAKGKAIIIFNPADPPLMMRDTVYCLVGGCDETAVRRSIAEMVGEVQAYVPGFRLKQEVQFEQLSEPVRVGDQSFETGTKITVFQEVEGAAHYLPAFAGNLDIMTSAALTAAERLATSNACHVEAIIA